MRPLLEFVFIALGFVFIVDWISKSEYFKKRGNLTYFVIILAFIIFGWLLTGEGGIYNTG